MKPCTKPSFGRRNKSRFNKPMFMILIVVTLISNTHIKWIRIVEIWYSGDMNLV